MKTINILGSEYTIENDDIGLSEKHRRGEIDLENKIIRLKSRQELLEENNKYEDKTECEKDTIRHEIIHAVLYESGLKDYCYDEKLIEILTKTIPEIEKVIREIYKIKNSNYQLIKCLVNKYLDDYRYMYVSDGGVIYFYKENPGEQYQSNTYNNLLTTDVLNYLGRNQNDLDNKVSLIKDRINEIKFY